MYKDINPFGLRLPADLKEKAAKSAEENHRSMNAELVAVIQEHYREKTLQDCATGELLEELIRRFGTEGLVIQIAKKQDIP